MKVYVTCTAAEEPGIEHGAWIRLSTDFSRIEDQISEMTRKSPVNESVDYKNTIEEWVVTDFGDVPEHLNDVDEITLVSQIYELSKKYEAQKAIYLSTKFGFSYEGGV